MNENKKEVVLEAQVQEQPKLTHFLKIIRGQIILDDTRMLGVVAYELKGTSMGKSELTLKLIINSSDVDADKKYVEFSNFIIKKKALEILGTQDVDIILESPGKVKIIAKCNDNDRFNEFKEWIQQITPIGAIVTIFPKY